jgi:hypothetical protein
MAFSNKSRKLLWPCLFTAIFLLFACIQIHNPRDGAPLALDQAEVHNIAWNLAHGRGYSFNWDDPGWRKTYLAHSRPSAQLNMILCRAGSHPTMSRPPLMPLLVAAIIKLYPAHVFLGWRLLDAALFSLAACLLAAAVCSTLGFPAAVIVVAITLLDPLRPNYVPGWWTEGIAFDCVAALVWVIAQGRGQPHFQKILIGGVLLGLVCLDRSFFNVVLPLLALLLAYALVGRISAAVFILTIAIAIESPWLIRNFHLSGHLLLGSQGGFNLPDEYSDHAIALRGGWDGDGIGYVWTHRAGASPGEIAGIIPLNIAAMRPAHPLAADALYATMCQSLASEIAVCDVGLRGGSAWIRSHPFQLPRLFVMKITTQIGYDPKWIGFLFALAGAGLLLSPRSRFALSVSGLVCVYMVGIGLTHAMPGRFLVPILPPLYVLAALGITAIADRAGLMPGKG